MRKILYAVFLFGCCASLLSGCIKEKYTVPSEKGDALVQLNIGTRAVEETDGIPTNNETVLHSLRVYAFVDGQPAGHFYTKDGLDVNNPSFLMHPVVLFFGFPPLILVWGSLLLSSIW